MTFVIDTGVKNRKELFGYPEGPILDTILDGLSANPTQQQVNDAVYQHVVYDLRGPKMLKTVRAHLLFMWWPLLAPLAELDPDAFDNILFEYAEIASCPG